jgi:hypothetical protein
MTSAYPKRPPFFAHRFCRLLLKACVANEHGPDVAMLLVAIAHTEDAKGYRDAVTFWNHQIMAMIGVQSEKTLRRLRERAMRAGWLRFEAGRRGMPPRYWVVVPPAYSNFDDAPSDESSVDYFGTTVVTGGTGDRETGSDWEVIGQGNGKRLGRETGSDRPAFPPSPNTHTHTLPGPDDPACVCDFTPYRTIPADGTDEPDARPRDRRQPPDPSLATAPTDFDPLRHQEQVAAEFLVAWNSAGLSKRDILTATEKGRLVGLLAIPWWAAGWREGIAKAARSPFFQTGAGRRGGRLIPGQFLQSEQLLRDILDYAGGTQGEALPVRPAKATTDEQLSRIDQPAGPMPGLHRIKHTEVNGDR